MLVERIKPNEVILASVLTACAQLGALDQGMWVDKYIVANEVEVNSFLGTALIDMYAKCGWIKEAFSVFEKLHDKYVYPWTTLIFGLAMNGDSLGSMNVFSQMLKNGVQPNEVTYIAVLSACSHGGLVNEERVMFESMHCDYGIKPTVDHYGCMVNLFGRAGKLEEAFKLIQEMPMEPNSGIWGTLFGACMIHKDFELGKSVGNILTKIEPNQSGRYSLLANLYSKSGDWKEAANVRRKYNDLGVVKSTGYSWIASNGVVHEFVAFDESHEASEIVYDVLSNLTAQLKKLPFVLEDGLLIV